MTKQSGLYQNIYVGGYDLSGDVGSIDSADVTREVTNVTGIDKGATERIYLVRDGAVTFTSFFNPSAGQSHPVLSALPTTDVGVLWAATVGASTFSIGDPAMALQAKQVNYSGNRDTNGGLTFTTTAQAAQDGVDWGKLLTPGRQSQSSAGALASLDNGASSAFGFQAHLHVFSLTGTSITVAIQSSSDDGAGDAFTDVTDGVFSAVTPAGAPASQQIETARDASIERYLRVNTTGTFSAASFAVVLTRNIADVN